MEQWAEEKSYDERDWLYEFHIARRAAQWGADQELEACCEWFASDVVSEVIDVVSDLRAARRPKPQTLNSIALQMLGTIERDAHYLPEITDTIRRALQALPE
jgi:protein-tyrosine phosphatase